MEFILIDDVADRVVSRQRFVYELPVTRLTIKTGDWPTGLYRGIVAPAGAVVDPAVRNFSAKIQTLIVRPRRPSAKVLFVAPTDMWRAYAANGGHAMTSWRDDYRYISVGYSPTSDNAERVSAAVSIMIRIQRLWKQSIMVIRSRKPWFRNMRENYALPPRTENITNAECAAWQ